MPDEIDLSVPDSLDWEDHSPDFCSDIEVNSP